MIKAVGDTAVSKVLSAQVLDPMPMSPERFAQRLKSDYDKYADVIKAIGARLD